MDERIKEARRLALRFAQSVHGDQSVDEAQSQLYQYLEQVIPQWQPIETAPKDGKTEIDLWISKFGRLTGCVWHIGSFDDTSSGHWGFKKYHSLTQKLPQEFTPTHWMPLPPPPTTTEVSS